MEGEGGLSMEAHERIIWSADVPTMKSLGRGIRSMKGLEIVKIDRLFMERRNPSIIKRIQEDFGVRMFDDAKMVEIPSKLEELALTHLKYRPWMLNCMAGAVSTMEMSNPKTMDGLKRFADACHRFGTRPCAVTVLTSKDEEIVYREFNGRNSIDQVLFYVGLLQECGFTDVVCSPLEVPAIRAESQFDGIDLDTPGIVLAGADAKDQARTNSPAAALAARATRLVIGRALTEGVWSENYQRVVREVQLALAA
jgi:orotidine-5'-phosphate decarboxylase